MEPKVMKKGMITELLYKGQKVYAVVAGFDDTDTTVRFPFSDELNMVEVVEIIVPNSKCSKPTLEQNSELAVFIRQLTAWDDPKWTPGPSA
jgi:hypothetical protein